MAAIEIKWAMPKSYSTSRTDFAKYECDKTDPKKILQKQKYPWERNKQREIQANHIYISWHKMNMCTLLKQENNGYSSAGESS